MQIFLMLFYRIISVFSISIYYDKYKNLHHILPINSFYTLPCTPPTCSYTLLSPYIDFPACSPPRRKTTPPAHSSSASPCNSSPPQTKSDEISTHCSLSIPDLSASPESPPPSNCTHLSMPLILHDLFLRPRL